MTQPDAQTSDAPPAPSSSHPPPDAAEAPTPSGAALVEEDLLVEDVSIDGMCGVY